MAVGLAGAGTAQAAVNYLVFSWSAGSTWTTPPAGLTLTVTARVQTTCPAGASKIAYGLNIAPSGSVNTTSGTISASGAVCVLGVPNTLKFTATGWAAGDVNLSLTDTTATALPTIYTSNPNPWIGPTYAINTMNVAIVLPDSKVINFASYINTDSGSPTYEHGVSIVSVGFLATAYGYYTERTISSNFTVAANTLSIQCNGCTTPVPISYLMGY